MKWRKVKTLFGEVEVERQRYRCRDCRHTFYPNSAVFETLGRGRISEKVWELGMVLALYTSYEQASRGLKKLLGVRVSATSLQQEVVSRGLAESERQGKSAHFKAAFAAAPESAPASQARGRRYVQMDGCFVHKWHSKANFEVKVGEIFSDPILTESGKRKWVEHKEYVSFSGDSEVFGERLYAAGERWDLSQAEQLYVLGDGASWIKSLWSEYFPHARFILDWWHVQKWVWTTVREVVSDEKRRRGWVEEISGPLFEGELDKALALISELPARTNKQRDARDALANYLLSNKAGIHNYRVVQEQGIHIGSGVIEKACMDVIGRRLKHRGMGWTPAGAEALVCLRTLDLNDRWDEYWQHQGMKKAA